MIQREYSPDEVKLLASESGRDVEVELPDGSRFAGIYPHSERACALSWLYKRSASGGLKALLTGLSDETTEPVVVFGSEVEMLAAVSRVAPALARTYACRRAMLDTMAIGEDRRLLLEHAKRVCAAVRDAYGWLDCMELAKGDAKFAKLRKRLKPLVVLAGEALDEHLGNLPVVEIRCDPGDGRPWVVRARWAVGGEQSGNPGCVDVFTSERFEDESEEDSPKGDGERMS